MGSGEDAFPRAHAVRRALIRSPSMPCGHPQRCPPICRARSINVPSYKVEMHRDERNDGRLRSAGEQKKTARNLIVVYGCLATPAP